MKYQYALISRRRHRIIKAAIGLVVVLSLFILLFLIWIGQDQLTPFSKAISFQSRIQSAENIKIGMPVLISGMVVGEVSGLELEPTGSILISIRVKEKFHFMVTTNTRLKLHTPLIGSAKLNLVTAEHGRPKLEEHSFLPFPVHSGMADLMSALPSQIARVEKILKNAEQITSHLSEKTGPLFSAVDNLDAITLSLKKFIDRETSSTGRISKSMDQFHQSLKQLEPLINEMNGTVSSLSPLLSRVGPIMTNVEKGSTNSVVVTMQLQTLLAKVNDNVLILERILTDVQQTSMRFNKVSPEVATMIDRTCEVTEQANQILDAAKHSPFLKGAFPGVDLQPVENNPRIQWPLKNED
jgi:ABC-type transporter Mla subunit MlaD